MRNWVTLIAFLACCSCSSTYRSIDKDGDGIEILAGDAVPTLLRQCSRDVPKQGEGTWVPRIEQILAIEKALVPLLKERRPAESWVGFPQAWARRYVGIVRGGRHFIYGDFGPHGLYSVCDGGAAVFGAEWDVASGKFSHIAFNGNA